MDVDCELSLSWGAEWVTLALRGDGLELTQPLRRVRVEAGVPLKVRLRADAAQCVHPEAPCQLLVRLDDGAQFVFPLAFEEAIPGRLAWLSAGSYLAIRVFPGESRRTVVPLRNDGLLDYRIAKVSVTNQDDDQELAGVTWQLLDARERALTPPCDVLPGEVVHVRLDCQGSPPGKRRGLLRIGGADSRPFQLNLDLDATEPPLHPFPVALDFGTTASAVATQPAPQRQGRVASIAFRSADENRGSSFLPSDVEIVRHPERSGVHFEIDWGEPSEDRHLGYARNLKRRIGLVEGHRDSSELVVIDGRLEEISVQELAEFVIKEMKRQTEHRLERRLDRVIATFPTRFSLRRINALREMYIKAGLSKVVLLDEAMAAGILGMYNEFIDQPEYNMLVYDMGGGTTDVTLFHVVNRRRGKFVTIEPTVLGVAGDPQLGGRDVTELMMRQLLESLAADERQAIPWPGEQLDYPELKRLARRNQNNLFLQMEEVKVRLFPIDPQAVEESIIVHANLYGRDGVPHPVTGISYTPQGVQDAFRPRLERLWREVLDMVRSSGAPSLDFLYLAGRGSLLPAVRHGLTTWLAAEGGFPKLQTILAQNQQGDTVLKEAVSLGAALAFDLIEGRDESVRLVPPRALSASRYGFRFRQGFREVLPVNSPVGVPSEIRVRIPLANPFHPDRYEARLEVWESPTRTTLVEDDPEAELVGFGHLTYPAEEIGPSDPEAEVGLKLHEDRTLKLLAWRDGEVKEVPVAR